MADNRTDTLIVKGMACEACAGHVRAALLELAGVQSADVSLDKMRAVVTYDPSQVDTAQMLSAIEEEGYDAMPVPD